VFNGGSPYNVPAGHGHANVDQIIEKYDRENRESHEKRMKALQSGQLKER